MKVGRLTVLQCVGNVEEANEERLEGEVWALSLVLSYYVESTPCSLISSPPSSPPHPLSPPALTSWQNTGREVGGFPVPPSPSFIRPISLPVSPSPFMSSLLLHEVLSALLGHPGDLIRPIHTPPPHSTLIAYKLNPSLSFISPSERQQIDSLLHLAPLYHHLLAFTSLPSSPSPPAPPPLYLSALRFAVSTVLSSYRSTLLHAESLASTPPYPLSSLQLSLQPFTLLLPSLTRLISPHSPPHGCQYLSLIHSHTHTAYPLVHATYQHLLHSLHRTLLGQVECWCAYGRIQDPHGEFFIAQRGEGVVGEEGDDRYAAVWDGSLIRSAMIPSYLPLSIAERIHFIGRAVCILHLSPSSPPTPLFLTPPFTAFLSALATLRTTPPSHLVLPRRRPRPPPPPPHPAPLHCPPLLLRPRRASEGAALLSPPR